MRVEIDGRIIDCNIQYGKGKKMSINIDAIGFITVKAPNNLSEEAITNANLFFINTTKFIVN